MVSLTVLLAPAGRLASIRDTLQDWSGAGLVDRFLWIEPAMVSSGRIAALSVVGGRLDGETLHSLAGHERFDRIRIAVLVPALVGVPGVPNEVEQTVVQFLESSFGSTPVTRIRAIVSRVGETGAVRGLVVDGWHNIVLSSEDSSGPGVGSNQLQATADILDTGIQSSAALAGLLGMWAGIEASPLDAERLLPGKLVRLSRSYYRHLGTAQLESSLRRQVLSMERGLPLPTQFGMKTVYVEDAPLAATTMADQLWVRHDRILKGPRANAAPSPFTKIGALEALRMFFGFLGAALRNAPRAWTASIINKISARAASAVHSLVFGSAPSAYALVVNGVTADGMPATWLDITEAAKSLDKILADPTLPREHAVHDDLSALWQDYAAASMTLADAGERVIGLTPVQIGAQRGVLRHAGLVVPNRRNAFDGVPPHLGASVGISTVEPFDVLGAFALEERLRKVADQPSIGVAAAAALQSLGQWKIGHFDSFAARVGTRIGESLYSTAAEIRGLLGQIRQAASADELLANIQAKQKHLAKVLQVLSIVVTVALCLVLVLYLLRVVGSTLAIILGSGLLLVWLVGSLVVFLRGQRDLFALINARRALVSSEELARRNLRYALADARRLGDAYSQFLAWSRILGTVLDSPFGDSTYGENVGEREISDLPLSVRLATAWTDDSVLASTSNEIRRDIFSVGWLTTTWDTAITNAFQQIGPLGSELRADPAAIYGERGDQPDSLLTLWANALGQHGVGSSVGDGYWTRILGELQSERQPLADVLLGHVAYPRLDAGAAISYEVFMGRVDAPERLSPDQFGDGLLSDGARSTGVSRVESSSTQSYRSGLGRTVCMTQMSAGFAAYELLAYVTDEDPVWGVLQPAPGSRPSEHPGSTTSTPELFNGTPF